MRFPLSIKRPPRVYAIAIAIAAVGLVALIAVWSQPALLRVGTLFSLLNETAPPKLPVPVQEVTSRELEDTWGAPRSDNRRHEGIDIFAPLGRPVLSTTNGVVFKVGEDNLGGHVVRVLGPGWQWHYYAHLDRFADIKPGSVVNRGSVLGYVGNTGNAAGTPYHLHYGVYQFLGGAQNPYPLLADDQQTTAKKETADKNTKRVHTARRSSKKNPPAKKAGPQRSLAVKKAGPQQASTAKKTAGPHNASAAKKKAEPHQAKVAKKKAGPTQQSLAVKKKAPRSSSVKKKSERRQPLAVSNDR